MALVPSAMLRPLLCRKASSQASSRVEVCRPKWPAAQFLAKNYAVQIWLRSSASKPSGRASEFREMAEKLANKETSSKYLDRLRSKVNTEQALEDVITDMRGEMAASLGRAGDKVNFALLKLELHEDRGGSEEEFNALRQEALKAREELVIQRIACGFRFQAQDIVNSHYPIPPAKGAEGCVPLEEQNRLWRENMEDVTSGAALHRWRKNRGSAA